MQQIGYNQNPIEDGSLKVVVQDQTTPPFVGFLLQSGTTFTLASPTQKSTITTLYYSATLAAGHGLSPGDTVLFSDSINGNSLYATVLTVATNDITIDRPWDHSYPVTSLCRIVYRDMAVNGAITEQIFGVQVGAIPADIYGINIYIQSGTEPDDSKFGDLSALTRGVVIRLYDGYDKIICCAKTNGEMRSFGSPENPYNDKGGGGSYGTSIYIPIREQWGVPLRLCDGSQLQAIVQDNLNGLQSAHISFVGQYTAGETV